MCIHNALYMCVCYIEICANFAKLIIRLFHCINGSETTEYPCRYIFDLYFIPYTKMNSNNL